MTVISEIERVERVLPGKAAAEGETDPRWQAIIELHSYFESDPEPLWEFALRWGQSPDEDLRTAIAVCVLEHLLEYHFALLFPKVEQAVRTSRLFADCFSRCGRFGQTKLPANRVRFDALQASVRVAAV